MFTNLTTKLPKKALLCGQHAQHSQSTLNSSSHCVWWPFIVFFVSLCLSQCSYAMFYVTNKHCSAIRHLHISYYTVCLSQQFCITLVFVSSGYYIHPKRNWRQCLYCKMLFGKNGASCGTWKWGILTNFTKTNKEKRTHSLDPAKG